ncbi:MAG: trehalose-phosphatase [Acidobacteriaceae bacterium]|nr:trehalose-phosphatase [Acidobacteriaceae bacterium]
MRAAEMETAAPIFDPSNIEPRIAAARRIALFLDFDGTISPIVPVPSEAEIDPAIVPVLRRLASRDEIALTIASGRALDDVRRRVPIPQAMYVGNHGLEIEAGEQHFRHPEAEALRPELKCVALQLQLALSDIEGVEIEHKGITLSVHYRRVNEPLHEWIRHSVLETIERFHSFAPHTGKKVVEVRPAVDWNKGHAVRWICREVLPASALPIYIGDDATDEDAFAAIPEGITIRVGDPAHTNAQYLVRDVPAVGEFLNWLDLAKPHGAIARHHWSGQ